MVPPAPAFQAVQSHFPCTTRGLRQSDHRASNRILGHTRSEPGGAEPRGNLSKRIHLAAPAHPVPASGLKPNRCREAIPITHHNRIRFGIPVVRCRRPASFSARLILLRTSRCHAGRELSAIWSLWESVSGSYPCALEHAC